LIKLADRLHNMRTIRYMDPSRYEEKAKETIEIFSPIAAKFNISKIKTELDDLALKYI
jgi:(p)ppGpp synthase/HD superfamily hydrolase